MAKDFREQQELKTQRQAALLGYQYVDAREALEKGLIKGTLSVDEMLRHHIVPIHKDGLIVYFGITTATSKSSVDFVRQRYTDIRPRFFLISESGYKEVMNLYNPVVEPEYDDIALHATNEDGDQLQKVSQTLESINSDQILDYLISQAVALNASDIHSEAQKDAVRIRMRVDGILHPVAELSHAKYRQIESAIAINANVIKESDGSQTGHWMQVIEQEDGATKEVNIRIEIVPTLHGYDSVIRLFSIEQDILNLENLDLRPHHKKVIDEVISNPKGMVLVVGPTGSGKSTTLYSMLNQLNTPERKIITLEDPVEYSIEGISQIPIESKKGESFATGLRSVLRLDPDVVMVGEIRDADTARTALQASLTGHLVMSTFHANDAATAFLRLLDLIEYNPMLLNSIRLVAAQRLVRKLDDATKVAYKAEQSEVEVIEKILATLPESIKKPDLNNLQLYKPGTSPENPFGYSGRQLVVEQIAVNEEITQLIQAKQGPLGSDQIIEVARKSGFISMQQDAVLRAVAGETDLREVFRAIGF